MGSNKTLHTTFRRGQAKTPARGRLGRSGQIPGPRRRQGEPLAWVQGQILLTEPVQRVIHHTFSGICPLANGEITLGMSEERVGLDRRNTFKLIVKISKDCTWVIPSLTKLRIVRAFSGIRVVPQDGLPILGRVPGHPGLYLAVTHSGYTLAPIVGTTIAELLIRAVAGTESLVEA